MAQPARQKASLRISPEKGHMLHSHTAYASFLSCILLCHSTTFEKLLRLSDSFTRSLRHFASFLPRFAPDISITPSKHRSQARALQIALRTLPTSLCYIQSFPRKAVINPLAFFVLLAFACLMSAFVLFAGTRLYLFPPMHRSQLTGNPTQNNTLCAAFRIRSSYSQASPDMRRSRFIPLRCCVHFA